MKIRLIGILLFYLFSDNCVSQTSSACDWKAKQLIGHEKYNLRRTGTGTEYDVKYVKFEFKTDPRVLYLKGKVSTSFVMTITTAIINFDFHDSLRMDSILYHGSKVVFFRAAHKVKIYLPAAVSAGVLDSLSFYYQGKPRRDGFGYFVRDMHKTGPIVFTLSEPYGSYYWWPCKQGLTDKIDSMDMFITSPKPYRAASNGVLISEVNLNDSDVRYHWKHRYPIVPYLVAIAVTNYSRYTEMAHFVGGDSMPIVNYVFPQDSALAVTQTNATAPMLRLFDSLFTPYPFKKEKYGHAQYSNGGGMEHQTMSFMGNFSYDLVAHELAHQWFGDMATCGTWSDLWLNEGFATYLNGLVHLYLNSKTRWQDYVKDMISQVTSVTNGSVYVADTMNLGRLFSGTLTYKKGAMVLHMLRWKLGDDKFYQGVNNYLNMPGVKYGFGLTGRLKYSLEQVSGMNLTEFFNDWYYGQGYPTYDIEWKQVGKEVQVQIAQTSSDASVSFFNVPVPLYFKTDKDSFLRAFDAAANNEIFTFTTNNQIKDVVFDPDYWLLAKALVKGRNYNLNLSKGLAIWPNISDGKFSIISKDFILDKLEVYAITGQKVVEQSVNPTKQKGVEIGLDISHLGKGIYFVKCFAGRNEIASKVVLY